MHACGHGAYATTILLGGVEDHLHELRNEWEGTIKLIFQPGEEKIPAAPA